MRLSKLALWLLIIALCLAASIFGSALSKCILLNPQINRSGLVAIAADGWMESQAQVDLRRFEPGVSKLKFAFNPWRPAGRGEAKLSFRACDKELANAVINEKTQIFWLGIPSDCKATVLNIVTLNPFRAQDGRSLGVRLNSVIIKYPWSHLLKIDAVAIVAFFALFFLMISLYLLELPLLVFATAAGSFAFLTVYCMRSLSWDNQYQLLCLVLSLSFFSLGLNSKFINKNLYKASGESLLTKHQSLISISLIFMAGAVIRFYGVKFGFPDRYHPDEPRKAAIAFKMAKLGDLDPNYFLHPTLLLYLTALYGKIGELLGFFPTLTPLKMNYCGRLVSATFGALSIPVLYRIGNILFNKRVALISAFALAFAPLSVTCSRYLKEDTLLTFFVLLTTLICVKAVAENRPRNLLLAGFVAGLSASSKYSGALSCIAIFFTPWLKSKSLFPDKQFFYWGCLSAVFVPVGFIIASPYVVLNYDKFINHLNAEEGHMMTGHHKVVISSWSQYWMYHLSRSIVPGLTLPLTILGIFGFGTLLRYAGVAGFYILALFLAFYLPVEAVNAKPAPQPERYILPCIPFLILAASFALDALKTGGMNKLSYLLLVLALAIPTYRSIGLASELKHDTRVQMRDWIIHNVSLGSKIGVDAQAYSAFLPEDKFAIEPIWSIAQRRSLTVERLKAEGMNYLLLTNKSYDRYFLTQSADQLIRARFEDVFTNWMLVKEFKSPFGNYGFSNPDLALYKVERR